MKDKKKIERFIELRAQNKTLDEMSKELGVDYETLARWNSEYRYEIKNKRALMQEGLHEKYYLNNHTYHTILKEIYFSPPSYMTNAEIEYEKNRKEETINMPNLDIFAKYRTK